ncbi:MAG TPA: NAD(P)H-dependent oxidoreductase [Chlamydiales bacterium]|nr:NAD(P)H-dependent oxidoreductase [Chlamydiales bacterium]
MKRLLHIIASPREDESRTLQVSNVFLENFKKKHPDWVFDELNLFKESIPSLSQKSVSGKYVLLSGKDLYGSLKDSWAEIIQHIERFKTADFFLISTPMWNFSIPYTLKNYIDVIVQPKHLFRYKENGEVEGLVKDKRMVVVASRGGQYSNNPKMDFQEPYLRTIFNFVGIQNIEFIIAEPMDMNPEVREQQLNEAKKKCLEISL